MKQIRNGMVAVTLLEQMVHEDLRNTQRPQGVGEPSVRGARIDEEGETKLADVS